MRNETEYTLQVEAINRRIRIDYGKIYYERNTEHGEPLNYPYTSILYKRTIDEGGILEHKDGIFTLYKDRSKTEVLGEGNNFVGVLGHLADKVYRQNMVKEHEAKLSPDVNYISKGNPEKKQSPFVLSKIL